MSEQNPFGLHVMDNNVNWSRAYDYMAQAQSVMSLVFNNTYAAWQMKARWPKMHVVHRRYNANDHQWHIVTGPLEWFTAHKAHGVNGVIVQCYNEPDPNDLRVIDFMLGVWEHARGTQTHVVGPNYSVGNPNEKRIEAGDYDRLIREVATNPFAWLGLHEYTKGNPETEYPYLIGRHTFWYARAEKLGLKLERVLITEHGLDMGGGQGDGWRNQGISGQQYADMLIRARALSPYRPPVAIFGFGDGFGWSSFNCDDDGFLNRLKTYREPVDGGQPPVDYNFVDGVVTAIGQQFARVRNATIVDKDPVKDKQYRIGTVVLGDAVRFDPAHRPTGSGYAWWTVDWNGQVAYIAEENMATGYVVCDIALDEDNEPVVLRDIPYISQKGANADSRQNDCGIACALMVYQGELLGMGFGQNNVLTVDAAIEQSPLVTKDDPVGLVPLADFCKRLGMDAFVVGNLTVPNIRALLDKEITPILLVSYKHILPADPFDGGHYVVATGYNTRGLFVHDPYNGGDDLFVDNARMDKALTDLDGAAALDYQGVVCGHPGLISSYRIEG